MGSHGYWDGRDALLHYPHKHNPDYEREPEDGFDPWWAEDRLRVLSVKIDWLENRIWDLECDVRIERAAKLADVLDRRRAEYKRLQQQLNELEGFY